MRIGYKRKDWWFLEKIKLPRWGWKFQKAEDKKNFPKAEDKRSFVLMPER